LNQFGVRHFRQHFLSAAFKQVGGQLCLFFDQRIDFFFDRSLTDEFVDQDVAFLADPEGSVGRLVLDSGIPPTIEVDDM
jgi:hypothetical protein